MRVYTFIKDNREGQQVEARSLKKALKKYSGEPDKNVLVMWKSKKGNETNKYFDLPYKTRKERKGKLRE